MYEDPTGYRNSSGAPDPPAYRALARPQDEAAAMDRLLGLRRIFYALAKHDGVWVNVEMQDKRTGVKLG